MSEVDFNHLSSDSLPVVDASGQLVDSPIERTSTSFLVLGDESYGPYGYGVEGPESQITALQLYGATPEEINHGLLYIDIVESTLTIRTAEYGSGSGAPVASAYLSGFTPGKTFALTGTSNPNIKGSVTLSSANEDWYIRLYLPTSSVVPLITEDIYYNISDMWLHGVTAANSDNGVLTWSLTQDTSFAYLTLSNPLGGDVASATAPLASYPPLNLELVAENGSGITGSVVLESLAPGSGHLVIKVDSGVRASGSAIIEASISVSGEGRITGNTAIGGAPSGTSLNKFRVYGGSDNHSGISMGDNGSDVGTMGFLASDGSKRGMIQLNDANSSSGDRLGLYAFSYGYLNEVLSVRGGGAVGVNRLSPTFTLDVNGTLGVSGVATFNGVPRFNSGNTTGSGTASLGSNSPASTLGAPYTWLPITTSDGSTGYIPVWK